MKYSDLNEIRARGTPDFPIELYRIDSDNARYIMPYHWHDEFEIIMVEEGFLSLTIDEREYSLNPGDIAFIGGGQIHGGIPEKCVYLCVVFDTEMLCGKNMLPCTEKVRIAADSRLSDIISFYPAGKNELNILTEKLMNSFKNEGSERNLAVLGALYSIFAELYNINGVNVIRQTDGDRFSGEHRLKAVLQWIEENYSSEISLKNMADIAEMNPGYFCEFFKKFIHRSPLEYINLYRIDSACRRMKTSSCTVTEAAFSSGFNDLSYFIKLFKKYKGITPKQYKMKYDRYISR